MSIATTRRVAAAYDPGMIGAPPGEVNAARLRLAKWINGAAFALLLMALIVDFMPRGEYMIFVGLLLFFPLEAVAEWTRARAHPAGSRPRRRSTIVSGIFVVLTAGIWGWLLYAHFSGS
jgi:hypothetical protein